jgi:acid phosphatase
MQLGLLYNTTRMHAALVFAPAYILAFAIIIHQKIQTDPVTFRNYEIARDTACYPCTWLQSSKSPHSPGWGTWINLTRWTKRGITSPAAVIGTKKRLTEHEVLYKLGGNGPWIQRVTPDSPNNFPPQSCRVEQVHMVR